MSPSVSKSPIPLCTISICWIFAVRISSGCSFHYRFFAIRRDTKTDRTVVRDIELIAVVGLMGHEAQECAVVHCKNRNLNHNASPNGGMFIPKGGAKVGIKIKTRQKGGR